MGGPRTAWCADYWRGRRPVQGWWWRGSQKSNKPSKLPEIDKNGDKTGGFAHVLAYKLPKKPFFAQKYLTRYTHEMFFEKYVNFQHLYLSQVLHEVKKVPSFFYRNMWKTMLYVTLLRAAGSKYKTIVYFLNNSLQCYHDIYSLFRKGKVLKVV
jgi:hypothetical protein